MIGVCIAVLLLLVFWLLMVDLVGYWEAPNSLNAQNQTRSDHKVWQAKSDR